MADTAHSSRGQSGFTLLELLIVITILGLILAALANGVRFAGQAWQAQERRSARQGDSDAVQNVLRELITSGTGFEGDGASLRFVSVLPAALARGGLYDVELRAAADRLVLAWQPHFKGPNHNTGITETELTRDVTGLDVSYYITPDGWQRTARDKTKPPELIRIALQTVGHAWPPLVVAPMVESSQTDHRTVTH
jgi:prepilin-type N-terminal cleavage/methylation domain-containing protein